MTTALSNWEEFSTEIKAREEEIASQLPSTVTRERFINAAIAAVKRDPGILKATPRSLFAAIIKSASDGLLPDGREGVITVYAGEATWNPMIYGLRKRARETDGLIVDAQVVFENDFFEYAQGDEPYIRHVPAQLGVGRGRMIGAYAIFKSEPTTIIHREVMDGGQIQMAQKQSKKPDSVMWVKFTTEAWRKVVARRGFKSVPSSPALMRVVTRDDDQFDFKSADRLEPPAPPPEETPAITGGQEAINTYLTGLENDLSYASTGEMVEEAWDAAEVQANLTGHEEALERAFALKERRLNQIANLAQAKDVGQGDTITVGYAVSGVVKSLHPTGPARQNTADIAGGEPGSSMSDEDIGEPPEPPDDDDDTFPGDR